MITLISFAAFIGTMGAVVWLMARDVQRDLERRLAERERFFED